MRELPTRYLSDDGLCAIDVHMSRFTQGDISSDHEIAMAAQSILMKCVLEFGLGGRGMVQCMFAGAPNVRQLDVRIESCRCFTSTS